jgi:uncharacterized repeat protein (TIGR01451 family)
VKSFVRSVVFVAIAMLAVSQLGAGVAAAQSADLTIEKWVFGLPDRPIAADAPFEYKIMAFSNGDSAAENVVVTDVLPPGVVFESADVSWPEGASCAFDGPSHTVTCNLGTLDAFDASFIDLHVRAPSVAGTIENTATVSASTPDPVSENNSFTVSTEVVVFSLSDLAVTVEASAGSVLVHRSVTFTTTVTNNGPQDAASVQLSLFPPANADISVTPSQGACELSELDIYECLLGPLASGASATVIMEVKPQKDGFALLFAAASSSDPSFYDPDSLNDFDSSVVFVSYPGNADPAFTTMEHQVVPLSGFLYNPCADEFIAISGELRQVVSSTFSSNRFRTNTYTSFHQLSGVGVTSGTEYRGHGASRTGTGLSLVKNDQFPRHVTTVDTFTLIGDDGSKLLLHQNTHFTINANGTFTSTVDNPILECKQLVGG